MRSLILASAVLFVISASARAQAPYPYGMPQGYPGMMPPGNPYGMPQGYPGMMPPQSGIVQATHTHSVDGDAKPGVLKRLFTSTKKTESCAACEANAAASHGGHVAGAFHALSPLNWLPPSSHGGGHGGGHGGYHHGYTNNPATGGTLVFPQHPFVRSPRDFFMMD